jgi:S1-C subfamily serine protease
MLCSNSSRRKASASLLALMFTVGLLVGGLSLFYLNYKQVSTLQTQINDLQTQISTITGNQSIIVTNETVTVIQNGTNIADIYAKVSNSIVLVFGDSNDGTVQGSGFVYNYSGRMVVITNNHVVEGTTSRSVTFSNGHGYAATILGTDPYADLAVLSVDDAPSSEFSPIRVVSSSPLRVGDQVIAIGNPYGLVGSLTTGVVSALNRTLQENSTMRFSIASVIQSSTPINPGNSGGPLLNAVGDVVGITTAIVSDSQGLGFAIPSNTILREVGSLINAGSYNLHSYLGVTGGDMTYDASVQENIDITYGFYLATIVQDGPSDGKLQVNDVVIAMNGTVIRSNDDLASYLESNTLPGETLRVTVFRDGGQTNVNLVLGTRPLPP